MLITPHAIKAFIIATLGLEDLAPDDIGDEQPLFTEGLGLDSIDALELGIALRREFHIASTDVDPATPEDFRNVVNLVGFISRHSKCPDTSGQKPG
jgi:acyl carrier protein